MRSRHLAPALALVLIPALALSACGKSKKHESAATATNVTIKLTEQGKRAKYSLPTQFKGGLVDLTVTNGGKAPHGVQLVRLEGGHTPDEALKVIGSGSSKTPAWLRGEGGIGQIAPGATARASLKLAAGEYVITDVQGPGSSGPPGYAVATVTSGTSGSLPATPTTITAANPGKDKYSWDISGPLHPGADTVTFDSKGKDALHIIAAVRVTGHPSKDQILKALKTNGPPPAFVDQSSFASTAVIDGGKSQTTPLELKKPGEYLLFCPLTDRDGGKPHFAEGLLKTVQVK